MHSIPSDFQTQRGAATFYLPVHELDLLRGQPMTICQLRRTMETHAPCRQQTSKDDTLVGVVVVVVVVVCVDRKLVDGCCFSVVRVVVSVPPLFVDSTKRTYFVEAHPPTRQREKCREERSVVAPKHGTVERGPTVDRSDNFVIRGLSGDPLPTRCVSRAERKASIESQTDGNAARSCSMRRDSKTNRSPKLPALRWRKEGYACCMCNEWHACVRACVLISVGLVSFRRRSVVPPRTDRRATDCHRMNDHTG